MDKQGFQLFLAQLEGLTGSQRQDVMERLEELSRHHAGAGWVWVSAGK